MVRFVLIAAVSVRVQLCYSLFSQILKQVGVVSEVWFPHFFSLTMVCVVTLLYLQNKTLPLENTTDVLSTMASVCKVMLETP
jgi:uncharacterized membrane protein